MKFEYKILEYFRTCLSVSLIPYSLWTKSELNWELLMSGFRLQEPTLVTRWHTLDNVKPSANVLENFSFAFKYFLIFSFYGIHGVELSNWVLFCYIDFGYKFFMGVLSLSEQLPKLTRIWSRVSEICSWIPYLW